MSESVSGSKLDSVVYPMWIIECEHDGFVCTLWEKPGTGCSYIEQCPSCGNSRVTTTCVTDKENHIAEIERANTEAKS
jgi:hypothetical protein